VTEGKVYLVGAGPGDPGLITQKGLKLLKKAHVVIYDRLLDENLLGPVAAEAEKIYVGKSATEHIKEQDEINKLLVKKAKEGKIVVRLKGGDPFVFGRGGEEAEFLEQNHILFEVVPGVSSAIAVPTYAGIPVTHRAIASSLAVVTGHEDPSKAGSSIDWAKLATGVDTLVFLMGVKNLSEIVMKLVEHGRPADTPVAIIKDGTGPQQKTVVGSLENIVTRVRDSHLEPPAVIVVGNVVRLREKLRWFDNHPLFGKRVLVPRARHQASVLSELLSERGTQPVELPVIEIQPVVDTEELDQAILNLGRYQWLVLTSVNGVEALFGHLYSLKLDARALGTLKIGCIGPATARAIENRGIIPDYVPEVYSGRGFIEGLKSLNVAGQSFLLLRADIADTELVEGIRQLGATAHEIVLYRTTPATGASDHARKMLQAGQVDVITFTSSSTVTNLIAIFKGDKPVIDNTIVACIGPKTADTATRAGLKVDIVAREHTIPGLVAAIEDYFREEG